MINLGIFGWKGCETRKYFLENMNARLSERTASCKRACPGSSGHSTLKRAASEQEPMLQHWVRSSEPLVALANWVLFSHFDFSFCDLCDLSKLSITLLWLCLIIIYLSNLIETSFNLVGLGFHEIVQLFRKMFIVPFFRKRVFLRWMI